MVSPGSEGQILNEFTENANTNFDSKIGKETKESDTNIVPDDAGDDAHDAEGHNLINAVVTERTLTHNESLSQSDSGDTDEKLAHPELSRAQSKSPNEKRSNTEDFNLITKKIKLANSSVNPINSGKSLSEAPDKVYNVATEEEVSQPVELGIQASSMQQVETTEIEEVPAAKGLNSKQNVDNADDNDGMEIDLSLDLQFQKAIEDHHNEFASNDDYDTTSKPSENENVEQDFQINESEQLKFIAEQLETATTSHKVGNNDINMFDSSLSDHNNESSNEENQANADESGDAELENQNKAIAAYNTLSQSTPPLSALAQSHLNSLPLVIVSPDYLPPRIQLLINTLPTLDNLATQLLRVVAIGPYQKVLDLVAHPDTPAGATYRDLTSLFEFTKNLYNDEDPFLTVENIAPGLWKEGSKAPSIFKNQEESISSSIRKINLATFLAATLGTIEVGFFHLNEFFLDVFCPYNNLNPKNSLSNGFYQNQTLITTGIVGKLLKQQAVIYLDLKTQAYISAIEAGERSREDIIEDIFPVNLDEILMKRRGTKTLTPAESDFVNRCKSRKENLLNYSLDEDLSEKYEWLVFLKELFEYVSKNIGFLIWGKKGRLTSVKEKPKSTIKVNEVIVNNPHPSTSIDATDNDAVIYVNDDNNEDFDQQAEASKVSKELLPSEIQERQLHLQLAPKNGSGTKIKHLHRRPWSREEEKSLRHALELKGPQWSQILELFGAGGKISEALKNRTQVQLKDKARNWKMFFLKSGLPVPEYLTKVTGDLEREDKMRSNSKRGRKSKKVTEAPVPKLNQAQEEINTQENDVSNNISDDVVDPSLQASNPGDEMSYQSESHSKSSETNESILGSPSESKVTAIPSELNSLNKNDELGTEDNNNND